MNPQTAAIGIGLIAGLAAGLMALAGLSAGTGAVLLTFAAPVAIQIATFGWGAVAGAVSVTLATVVAGYGAAGVPEALIISLILFVPAAWVAYLANLAQPGGDGGSLVWYPLSSILTQLAILIVASSWIAGYLLGFNEEQVAVVFLELAKRLEESRPDLQPPSAEAVEISARFYAAAIPFAAPAVLTLLHVLTAHVSARVTRLSGKLPRPADDIAATATLPQAMLAVPLAGIAGMFIFDPPLFDLAAVAAGTGTAAFALIGLAELHLITRGKPGRTLLLTAAYLANLLIGLTLLAFAILGAIRIFRGRRPPNLPPPNRGGNQT